MRLRWMKPLCSPSEFIALMCLYRGDQLVLLVLLLYSHAVHLLRTLSPPSLYDFGTAKSQAVSWAHLHMARTSRVKPMSLGFSSPRISRCFIMAMNSLLLSSPFPEGDRQGGGRERVWQRTDDEIIDKEYMRGGEEHFHLLMIASRQLKVTYYAKSTFSCLFFINMCPLCVKRFWKFQEKRFALFLSWSIYIKTCLKMSWSDFGHFMMS